MPEHQVKDHFVLAFGPHFGQFLLSCDCGQTWVCTDPADCYRFHENHVIECFSD